MLAIDAEGQGEGDGHAPELVCFTGARLRRPWRRGTSASMADQQGGNDKGQGERGSNRLLTRNSLEVATEAEVARRRRNRQRRPAGPATARVGAAGGCGVGWSLSGAGRRGGGSTRCGGRRGRRRGGRWPRWFEL